MTLYVKKFLDKKRDVCYNESWQCKNFSENRLQKGDTMNKFKSFWNKMYFAFHPNHANMKVKYLKVWGLGWIGYHHF
jgi:hypothetical protein